MTMVPIEEGMFDFDSEGEDMTNRLKTSINSGQSNEEKGNEDTSFPVLSKGVRVSSGIRLKVRNFVSLIYLSLNIFLNFFLMEFCSMNDFLSESSQYLQL